MQVLHFFPIFNRKFAGIIGGRKKSTNQKKGKYNFVCIWMCMLCDVHSSKEEQILYYGDFDSVFI